MVSKRGNKQTEPASDLAASGNENGSKPVASPSTQQDSMITRLAPLNAAAEFGLSVRQGFSSLTDLPKRLASQNSTTTPGQETSKESSADDVKPVNPAHEGPSACPEEEAGIGIAAGTKSSASGASSIVNTLKKLPSLAETTSNSLAGLSSPKTKESKTRQEARTRQEGSGSSKGPGETDLEAQISLLEDTLALREQDLQSMNAVMDGLRKERSNYLKKFEDTRHQLEAVKRKEKENEAKDGAWKEIAESMQKKVATLESEARKTKQQLLSTEEKLRSEVSARRKDTLADMQKSRKQMEDVAKEKDAALEEVEQMKLQLEMMQAQVKAASIAAEEASSKAEEKIGLMTSRLAQAETDRDEFTDRLTNVSSTVASLQMQLQAKEQEYAEYTEQTSEIRTRIGHMQTENLRLNQIIANMGNVTADLQRRNEEMQDALTSAKHAHEAHIQELTHTHSEELASTKRRTEAECQARYEQVEGDLLARVASLDGQVATLHEALKQARAELKLYTELGAPALKDPLPTGYSPSMTTAGADSSSLPQEPPTSAAPTALPDVRAGPTEPLGISHTGTHGVHVGELDKQYLKQVLLKLWETQQTDSMLTVIAGILRFDASDMQRATAALEKQKSSSSLLSFSLPDLASSASRDLTSNLSNGGHGPGAHPASEADYLKEVLLKLWETGKSEELLPVIGQILDFSAAEMQRAKASQGQSSWPWG